MPDPLERPVVAGERPRSSPTRDDQDVEGRRGLPGVVGKDAEAFGARDGPAVTGKREDLDAVVGPDLPQGREPLPGTGPVQLLGAVEEEDADAHYEARASATACSR